MNSLIKYFKGYKLKACLAPAFKFLECIIELTIPLIVAKIIDEGVKNNDVSTIVKLGLLMMLLGLIGLSFSIIGQYFSAKVAIKTSSRVRRDLYVKCHSLNLDTIQNIGASTLITRMTSDIDTLSSGINLFLRLFLRSPFVVIGCTVMAFSINFELALIFVITVIILSIIIALILKVTMPKYKQTQADLDNITSLTRENLNGSRVVRAFNMQDMQNDKMQSLTSNLCKNANKVAKISNLLNPLTFVVVNFAIIALIYMGAFKVEGGVIEQGLLIALYNYMAQILVELIKLANLIVQISKAIASQKRLVAILNIDDTLPLQNSNQINQNYIEFKNVCYKYKNASANALTDISFTLKKGEKLGIIGGTGSGKSTIISILTAFVRPTSGQVVFDYKDCETVSQAEIREKIGLVDQKAKLFKGSIKTNLRMADPKASIKEINSVLEKADATVIVDSKEGGIEAKVEENGRNFSGGQKQRISIARAILKKPEVLILDDSFSALDYQTEAKLRKSIKSLSFKPTVIIVSQRTSSLKDCDNILVMENGMISASGSHQELLQSSELYREIHLSQSKGGNL